MIQAVVQISLTREQRERLDAICHRDRKSLTEVVREALDDYLARRAPDAGTALAATYGALPELAVPPRDGWDRG